MALAALAAQLVLAVVFATAGLAKLHDRITARRSLVEFGLPPALARPAAVLLPLVELSVAAGLLIRPSARAAAIAAFVLLAVFAVAIAVNLAQGRRPECNCFGALHSEPVGWRTLARNAVLAAFAAFAVVAGPGTGVAEPFRSLDGVEAAIVVLAALLAGLTAASAWAALHLMRQNGRLLLRLDEIKAVLESAGIDLGNGELDLPEGLPLGSAVPAFALAAADGATVSLADLLAPGVPVLLVFTDPGCAPCDGLMPRVADWEAEISEVTIAVLSSGDPAAALRKGEEHGLRRLLLDDGGAVAASFKAYGTPTAVVVGADGRVASGIASGAESVERLVALTRDTHVESGLPLGALAPELRLPDLDGGMVELAEVVAAQGETLVLFWNPDCGFCNSMHDELLAWEEARPPDAPELLIVSGGDPEVIREDGFRSRVLVDPDFRAGDAFGAGGTPAAVLVGADGRVSSALAVGAADVLSLARTADVGGARIDRAVA